MGNATTETKLHVIEAPLFKGIIILALYSVPEMLLKAYLMLFGLRQRGTSMHGWYIKRKEWKQKR